MEGCLTALYYIFIAVVWFCAGAGLIGKWLDSAWDKFTGKK